MEWSDILTSHLRASPTVRAWFAHNVLFAHHDRFCEYLLESPSADIRSAFAKILTFVGQSALHDGDCEVSAYVYGESELTSKV